MASASTQQVLLSPAELAYLHASLSLSPPIRPDGRSPTQFRPLTAETGILPGTNGSARICFADGTEAIAGVKAEVERTRPRYGSGGGAGGGGLVVVGPPVGRRRRRGEEEGGGGKGGNGCSRAGDEERTGEAEWVEMTVEIPGLRDDDANTVFLSAMLSEALLADGGFVRKLWINKRFHWKLYLDIILISPPLSYPLPLLSLTTHLALLATRLPRLKSEGDEDPLFDDDWDASPFLYPRGAPAAASSCPPSSRPPVTLLVTAVGNNIMFDPAKEELAVADVAVAISVAEAAVMATGGDGEKMDVDTAGKGGRTRNLRLLSVRMIDPPSRLTPPGAPREDPSSTSSLSSTVAAAPTTPMATTKQQSEALAAQMTAPTTRSAETEAVEGVWKAPRGGTPLGVLNAIVQKVLEPGGIADEVLDGLEGVELG